MGIQDFPAVMLTRRSRIGTRGGAVRLNIEVSPNIGSADVSKERWRLLLPGASGPRLTELNPPGL